MFIIIFSQFARDGLVWYAVTETWPVFLHALEKMFFHRLFCILSNCVRLWSEILLSKICSRCGFSTVDDSWVMKILFAGIIVSKSVTRHRAKQTIVVSNYTSTICVDHKYHPMPYQFTLYAKKKKKVCMKTEFIGKWKIRNCEYQIFFF